MQITLSAIGKLKDPSLKALYEEYKRRLEWKIVLHEFESKTSIHEEGKLLLNSLPSSAFLITLDEKGENVTSRVFTNLIKDIQLHHQGKLAFVIGGPNGVSEELKVQSQKCISFGRMTWPHLMVRVMLLEQLYRAQQILKNHPYHRE